MIFSSKILFLKSHKDININTISSNMTRSAFVSIIRSALTSTHYRPKAGYETATRLKGVLKPYGLKTLENIFLRTVRHVIHE